jgi:hypothetical protein
MITWYRLKRRKHVPCKNICEWQLFPYARVRLDFINDVKISTVSLGIPHGHDRHGDLILFETMVFNGAFDGELLRASTHRQALRNHKHYKNKIKLHELAQG